MDVELGPKFANFGLKLGDMGLQELNLGLQELNLGLQERHQLGEFSTLWAIGGRQWCRVVHKPFIGRRF